MLKTIEASYGIRERIPDGNEIDLAVESLQSLGYAVLDSGFTEAELDAFSEAFDAARSAFAAAAGGWRALEALNEQHTIRLAFFHQKKLLELALHPGVRSVARRLLGDYHVLSQQNGVINPAGAKTYSQGAWHRDLPYQHVVFSRPLAINALFCLDAFTAENGATLVLPATHKQEAFPSGPFIKRNTLQVSARRGSYIILDCMVFHTGATNGTAIDRRAVNHVYTVPALRQQIDLPSALGNDYTDDGELRRLLGYEVSTPRSISEFLRSRQPKAQR